MKGWTMSELVLACSIAAKEAEKHKAELYYNPAYPEALYKAADVLRDSIISARRDGQRIIVDKKQLKRASPPERGER